MSPSDFTHCLGYQHGYISLKIATFIESASRLWRFCAAYPLRPADSLLRCASHASRQFLETQMRTFSLRYENDGKGEPKSVEFHGEDPHEAFAILSRERVHRRVSLWEGEKRLGTLTRSRKNFWELR